MWSFLFKLLLEMLNKTQKNVFVSKIKVFFLFPHGNFTKIRIYSLALNSTLPRQIKLIKPSLLNISMSEVTVVAECLAVSCSYLNSFRRLYSTLNCGLVYTDLRHLYTKRLLIQLHKPIQLMIFKFYESPKYMYISTAFCFK